MGKSGIIFAFLAVAASVYLIRLRTYNLSRPRSSADPERTLRSKDGHTFFKTITRSNETNGKLSGNSTLKI